MVQSCAPSSILSIDFCTMLGRETGREKERAEERANRQEIVPLQKQLLFKSCLHIHTPMRKKHTDSFPQPAATISEVKPSTVPTLGSAPASNNRLTTVSWPTYEAYMSGVHPPQVKQPVKTRESGMRENERMMEGESKRGRERERSSRCE